MTEASVLTFSFIITFGFLGYKLRYFINKILNNYIKKIEDNLNQSELLKRRAIQELDEANKKEKQINDIILQKKEEYELKIKEIDDNITKKLKSKIEDLTKNQKDTIKNNISDLTSNVKINISNLIMSCIDEYLKKHYQDNNNNKHEKNLEMIRKIDFKKFIQ